MEGETFSLPDVPVSKQFRGLPRTHPTVSARPGQQDIDSEEIEVWKINVFRHLLRIGVLRIALQDCRGRAGAAVSSVVRINAHRDFFGQIGERIFGAGRGANDISELVSSGYIGESHRTERFFSFLQDHDRGGRFLLRPEREEQALIGLECRQAKKRANRDCDQDLGERESGAAAGLCTE